MFQFTAAVPAPFHGAWHTQKTPPPGTFYISQKLGSGKFFLIGDAIEGQYVANNLHFAAAIAFILMLILLAGMALMKYFTTKHVYGGK